VLKSIDAQDAGVTPTFSPTAVILGGSTAVQVTPNPVGLAGQVYVCTDNSTGPHQDNVYVLASVNPIGSDPLDVHFIRSSDGGMTWSSPVRVNDDPAGNNAWQWFGAMSVAPSGRIDAIWNDTRNDPLVMFSELMYSYSTDGGATWSPNVALSAPFNHALGYPQQNKIGDYYDLVADAAGAHIAYAATFNGEQDVTTCGLPSTATATTSTTATTSLPATSPTSMTTACSTSARPAMATSTATGTWTLPISRRSASVSAARISRQPPAARPASTPIQMATATWTSRTSRCSRRTTRDPCEGREETIACSATTPSLDPKQTPHAGAAS
jgi:hypothetical protein